MKRGKLVLAAVLAGVLSGCVVRGKNAPQVVSVPPAPAPAVKPPSAPPQPLSIPQTQTQLPESQAISPEALATIRKLEPPAAVVQGQVTPSSIRPAAPAVSAPKPETPQAQTTQPPPAPAPATTEPEQRQVVQELVPADESKRLQDLAGGRKQGVRKALEQLQSHQLTREQRGEVARIQSFLQLSDEAEKRGDMRQADALAERAQILMRELQNGIR